MNQKPITLYTLGPALGAPDASPFPTKVMMFLKMHKIKFTREIGDFRNGPLKKIPYMKYGDELVPDSELIINFLEAELTLDKDELTNEQHTLGHLLSRTLEERTFWAICYFRWLKDESYVVLREANFPNLPFFLKPIIPPMIRKGIRKVLWGQGVGRHSEETIANFMLDDFKSVSDLLGDKTYLFGEKPTRYDCSAIGLISLVVMMNKAPSGAPDIFKTYPNLKAYWDRVEKEYFSD